MINWEIVGTTSRPCGTCTACCVGFLTADIYGTKMANGRKCKFLDKNCTIYNFRPKLCKDYICEWKNNSIVPERFKPDKSNILMHWKVNLGYRYLQILDRNKTINQDLHDWIHEKHLQGIYKHVIYYHYVNYPNDYIGSQHVYSKDEKFHLIFTETTR